MPIFQSTSSLRSLLRRGSLSTARKLHALILTSGLALSLNTYLLNAVLHVYALSGITRDADYLFNEIPHSHKDTADWTALLNCYAERGRSVVPAYSLFKRMLKESVIVDDVVLVSVLSLCARVGDLEMGTQLHAYFINVGLEYRAKACNALMNMYAKCGNLSEVRRVFREMNEHDVVSWSVLLDAVVKLEGAESGRVVFDHMPERNEVAWTSMIAGYVGSGFSREGFLLLKEMVLLLGFKLNWVSLCSICSACAQSGDAIIGRWCHVYALKAMGNEMDIMVGTTLVDMYAKCGLLNMAYQVFKYLPRRNVVAWNAMLGGLAMHGEGKFLIKIFPDMTKEAKPDYLTFIAVLNACSHSGLVDPGCYYFHNLEKFGITPKIEHYACMVDLLGRAGQLEEAENLIEQMPMHPNEVILGSLLGSCHVHRRLDIGERVLHQLLDVDPHNTECHVLLSNMYATAGKQQRADSLRQILQNKGIRKMPGMSSIHVNGEAHQFCSGDKSHPESTRIYSALSDLIQMLTSTN